MRLSACAWQRQQASGQMVSSGVGYMLVYLCSVIISLSIVCVMCRARLR